MNRPLLGAILGLTIIGIVISVLTWLFLMHTEVVEPGHELVVNDKPYFFGHEGVRDESVKEGRALLFISSSAVPVRMTPQSIPVKFDDFSSRDNILLDFESTIQFRVKDSVTLVKSFGIDWFANNVQQQYVSVVREALKKKTMTEMMSDVNAAKSIDDEVTAALQKIVDEAKLPIVILGVSLGRVKPNDNVLAQMNETAAQQQRQKTLVEAELAEQKRKAEQVAKAAADNAYRNAMQLSPEMFIQLEQIKRYAEACTKAGNVCVIGTGTPVQVTPHVGGGK